MFTFLHISIFLSAYSIRKTIQSVTHLLHCRDMVWEIMHPLVIMVISTNFCGTTSPAPRAHQPPIPMDLGKWCGWHDHRAVQRSLAPQQLGEFSVATWHHRRCHGSGIFTNHQWEASWDIMGPAMGYLHESSWIYIRGISDGFNHVSILPTSSNFSSWQSLINHPKWIWVNHKRSKNRCIFSWVMENVPIFHITQPWGISGLLDGYYFGWCPINTPNRGQWHQALLNLTTLRSCEKKLGPNQGGLVKGFSAFQQVNWSDRVWSSIKNCLVVDLSLWKYIVNNG